MPAADGRLPVDKAAVNGHGAIAAWLKTLRAQTEAEAAQPSQASALSQAQWNSDDSEEEDEDCDLSLAPSHAAGNNAILSLAVLPHCTHSESGSASRGRGQGGGASGMVAPLPSSSHGKVERGRGGKGSNKSMPQTSDPSERPVYPGPEG
eukprot:3479388-Rhodomonas_salina.4